MRPSTPVHKRTIDGLLLERSYIAFNSPQSGPSRWPAASNPNVAQENPAIGELGPGGAIPLAGTARTIKVTAVSTRVKVNLVLPSGIQEHVRSVAEAKAREAAVLVLWRERKLTSAQAALELGLSYQEFLGLFAPSGRVIVSGGHVTIVMIDDAAE